MRLLGVALPVLSALSQISPVLSTSLDAFIVAETKSAYNGLLANIGSQGAKSVGALNGVVVAAPSDDPDYKFTWVRDSSLVFKYLVDTYISGSKPTLLPLIYAWIAGESVLQNIDNPSGFARAGGLGEPKFELNLTAFTGSWGRPQRDGPALRASTIVKFGNCLLDRRQNVSYVTNTLWPILELDLNYVHDFWNQTGFDLWEEQSGSSHFTSAAQHRALRVGALFAKRLGHSDVAAQYTTQANNVLCFLQSYWSGSYIISNINLQNARTGLDANSLLTSIHNFDIEAGCDAGTFQPCSDKALANHLAVVDSFRSIYGINANLSSSAAVAIGRYAEDVYFNGNPWYLSVNAAAEQLYYALAQWRREGSITITATSLPFFQRVIGNVPGSKLLPKLKVGKQNLLDFAAIYAAVQIYADDFLKFNQKYTPADGQLSEQYDRNTGVQTSANDLTWSYASQLTAFNARAGNLPASWGAAGLQIPKSACQANPVAKLPVTFDLTGSPFPSASVVGSIIELSTWNPQEAIPMTPVAGTPGAFTVTIPIAKDSGFEYKFIYVAPDGTVNWESDPNNQLTLPSSGNFTVHNSWR